MRFLSTLILTLVISSCLSQDTISNSVDTVRYGDVIYLFKKDVLVERLHMKGDQIDIRVIYIYKEGVLLRREWWQRGKRISYTIDN
jgi:hypothetical protein